MNIEQAKTIQAAIKDFVVESGVVENGDKSYVWYSLLGANSSAFLTFSIHRDMNTADIADLILKQKDALKAIPKEIVNEKGEREDGELKKLISLASKVSRDPEDQSDEMISMSVQLQDMKKELEAKYGFEWETH